MRGDLKAMALSPQSRLKIPRYVMLYGKKLVAQVRIIAGKIKTE